MIKHGVPHFTITSLQKIKDKKQDINLDRKKTQSKRYL